MARGNISTVAGIFLNGFAGDGGPATSAQLTLPSDVTVDSAGNIFIADTWSQRIRKIDVNTGIIDTVAGDGTNGYGGDGGLATSAQLAVPSGVAVDSAGNIFIADSNNHRIRKVASCRHRHHQHRGGRWDRWLWWRRWFRPPAPN